MQSACSQTVLPPAGHSAVWGNAIAWQTSVFMALQMVTFYTLIDWFPAMAASAGIGATKSGAYLFAYQAIAVGTNLVISVAIKRLKDQRLLGFMCSTLLPSGW